jgi:hypothetical protein
MFGGYATEKTLLKSFGLKTSIASRYSDDDGTSTSVTKDLSQLSVGEGFFRESSFEKANNKEKLQMNNWIAFQKYSTNQGELVMDGGSRSIPIAILVTALNKVCAGSISDKQLATIVARQQYPSKAMLSWNQFNGLCFEIYHLNQGNFHLQGKNGGTIISSEKLSRKGNTIVQRPSRNGYTAVDIKHQPQTRHYPTEAERVLQNDADKDFNHIHDYHKDNMSFHGGVFDEPTQSISSNDQLQRTQIKQKESAKNRKELFEEKRRAILEGLGGSGSGSGSGSVTSSKRSSNYAHGQGNKVLVPKMKQTAFDLLIQKQRGASSLKMASLEPSVFNDIGTSHEFVDINISGTANANILGSSSIKVPTKKINSFTLNAIKSENQLHRNQIAEMKSLYPMRDKQMARTEAINRLTQPLTKHKVYTMTHSNESQLSKWQKMCSQREEREKREEIKEKRKETLAFVSKIVSNNEKETIKKTRRDQAMIDGIIKLEKIEKLKKNEEIVNNNIKQRKEDEIIYKKENALNLKMALNSSIELTQSIFEDEIESKKQHIREMGNDFKLNPSSSALLSVPDILKERVVKARTIEQYEQAKKDEREFLEETMSSRIKAYANNKFEKLNKITENTTIIPYGVSVPVNLDKQASLWHQDHMVDPNTGKYLYTGINESTNSNHNNKHKHKMNTTISDQNQNQYQYQYQNDGSLDDYGYSFNDSSLYASGSDFLHVLTPNLHKKYTPGGGVRPSSPIPNVPVSIPVSRMVSRSYSQNYGSTPSSANGNGNGKVVLISRADGSDVASPGRHSTPTSTTDIRKMPYKDKTGLKISPHGKNVYPVPQLNTGPALNTSQALRNGSINPPNSPPHLHLDSQFMISVNNENGNINGPDSPDSVGSKENEFIRTLAINEYMSNVSKIDESPRHHQVSNSNNPSPILGRSPDNSIHSVIGDSEVDESKSRPLAALTGTMTDNVVDFTTLTAAAAVAGESDPVMLTPRRTAIDTDTGLKLIIPIDDELSPPRPKGELITSTTTGNVGEPSASASALVSAIDDDGNPLVLGGKFDDNASASASVSVVQSLQGDADGDGDVGSVINGAERHIKVSNEASLKLDSPRA